MSEVKNVTFAEIRALPDLVYGSNFLVEFPAPDGVFRDENEIKLWRELSILCSEIKIDGTSSPADIELHFLITSDPAALKLLLSTGRRIPFTMSAALMDPTGKVVYRHIVRLDKQRVIPRSHWQTATHASKFETLIVRYEAQGNWYVFSEGK